MDAFYLRDTYNMTGTPTNLLLLRGSDDAFTHYTALPLPTHYHTYLHTALPTCLPHYRSIRRLPVLLPSKLTFRLYSIL